MPTYEYVCSACGHEFEKFQSIKALPVKECPACHKKKAERKISVGAGFIFKGSGFYETDYRNEAYKKAAEADKAPSTDAKTGEVKSVEAKPGDAKSDAKPAAESKSGDANPSESKSEPKVEATPEAGKSAAKPVTKATRKPKK